VRRSAGILLYRRRATGLEVLLVHPGGPLWAKKDLGAWSVPKGEVEDGETDLLDVALRELAEETGFDARPPFVEVAPVRQKSGKVVVAFLAEGDADTSALRSNTFSMEWPPRSGRMADFPEVDRAEWFPIDEARRRILPAQSPILDAVVAHVAGATAEEI
jgi:predicted NUDIX family NTP pyrophosphohydrolase